MGGGESRGERFGRRKESNSISSVLYRSSTWIQSQKHREEPSSLKCCSTQGSSWLLEGTRVTSNFWIAPHPSCSHVTAWPQAHPHVQQFGICQLPVQSHTDISHTWHNSSQKALYQRANRRDPTLQRLAPLIRHYTQASQSSKGLRVMRMMVTRPLQL